MKSLSNLSVCCLLALNIAVGGARAASTATGASGLPKGCACESEHQKHARLEREATEAQHKFGSNSIQYARALVNYSYVPAYKMEHPTEIATLQQAIQIFKQKAPSGAELVDAQIRLSQAFQKNLQLDEAESAVNTALKLEQARHDADAALQARALGQLANIFGGGKQQPQEALVLYAQAADRLKQQNVHTKDSLDVYDNYSTYAMQCAPPAVAEQILKAAIAEHAKVNGPTNEKTFAAQERLADFYFRRLHDAPRARKIIEQILAAREPVLGKAHSSLLLTLALYQEILVRQGDAAKVQEVQKRIATIQLAAIKQAQKLSNHN